MKTVATRPYRTYAIAAGKKNCFGRKMTPTMVAITSSDPRICLTLRYQMVGIAAYCTLLIIRKLSPSMMKRSI